MFFLKEEEESSLIFSTLIPAQIQKHKETNLFYREHFLDKTEFLTY